MLGRSVVIRQWLSGSGYLCSNDHSGCETGCFALAYGNPAEADDVVLKARCAWAKWQVLREE